jgi:hypothetical protein
MKLIDKFSCLILLYKRAQEVKNYNRTKIKEYNDREFLLFTYEWYKRTDGSIYMRRILIEQEVEEYQVPENGIDYSDN